MVSASVCIYIVFVGDGTLCEHRRRKVGRAHRHTAGRAKAGWMPATERKRGRQGKSGSKKREHDRGTAEDGGEESKGTESGDERQKSGPPPPSVTSLQRWGAMLSANGAVKVGDKAGGRWTKPGMLSACVGVSVLTLWAVCAVCFVFVWIQGQVHRNRSMGDVSDGTSLTQKNWG